jgi:hypothetical protein
MSKMDLVTKTFSKHSTPAEFGADVELGSATLKNATRRGVQGWDLPGGRFITCPFQAKAKAAEINRLIHANGGLPVWAAKHVKAAA